MNSQEAKFILQSWRANGEDATDPRFDEALQVMETDPALAAWFERELALDRIIANKLRSATASRTLAIVDLPQASPPTDPAAPLAVRQRQPWLAWAASLAILAVAWFVVRPALSPRDNPGAFRADMTAYLNAGFSLELMNSEPSALLEWMAARPALSDTRVPPTVSQLPAIGCRTLTWSGRPVGLLCFSDGGQPVHLFVLSRPPAGFEPTENPGSVVVQETAGWTTASWTRDGLAYLLARRGTESDTRRLLASLRPRAARAASHLPI